MFGNELLLLIIIYIFSTTISAGWLFAYIQNEFRLQKEMERENLGFSILMGLFCGMLGPIGILIMWLLTGFAKHGWRLK